MALVYVTTLPERANCVEILDRYGTRYTCGRVVYRPTYYQDEQVYEIVSPAPPTAAAASTAAVANYDTDFELLLTSPNMRGDRVRLLQNGLSAIGFPVGRVDGVFGRRTESSVREFQEWYGLPVTGIVDDETAAAIGETYSTTIAPGVASIGEDDEPAAGVEPAEAIDQPASMPVAPFADQSAAEPAATAREPVATATGQPTTMPPAGTGAKPPTDPTEAASEQPPTAPVADWPITDPANP